MAEKIYHPDPVCIALAQGTADGGGHTPGSKAWHLAYRTAYLEQNQDETGVGHYLLRYDAALEKMEARSGVLKWRAFYALRKLLWGREKLL